MYNSKPAERQYCVLRIQGDQFMFDICRRSDSPKPEPERAFVEVFARHFSIVYWFSLTLSFDVLELVG